MVNSLVYQGRLTADPELRRTQSGISFIEFTVAWSEKYNEIETKCFLRCKAWRGTAEFVSKYFTKGQEIVVEGKIVTEQWEKDGQSQSRTICDVKKVHFCGSKVTNTNDIPAIENTQKNEFMPIDDNDEIPF
jgi:single-strand DNA-binding protein